MTCNSSSFKIYQYIIHTGIKQVKASNNTKQMHHSALVACYCIIPYNHFSPQWKTINYKTIMTTKGPLYAYLGDLYQSAVFFWPTVKVGFKKMEITQNRVSLEDQD